MQQQYQPLTEAERRLAQAWRSFPHCDGVTIEQALATAGEAACPRCRATLVARQATRLSVTGAVPSGSYDVECGSCRRYHAIIAAPTNGVYLARLRRLATAVLQA
jgi:hypothetical protein